METYTGRFVRVSLEDGSVYDGYVHSWHAQTGKLSLEKVVYIEEDERKTLHGLQNFFYDEIKNIVATEDVIKSKTKTNNGAKKEKVRSLMKAKCNPPHLAKLNFFDPSAMVLKNFSEKDGLNSSGNEEGSSDPETERVTYPGCTILDKLDQTFTEALSFIQGNMIVAVSLEGVAIGRCGQLCWLQIATPDHVFMFDILKLGKTCFEKGLTAVLENEDVLKVLHDSRMVSDILHHQYDTKIVNVFDTQVASVIVYRMYHNNDWPRYVEGLTSCLVNHLHLSSEEINWALVRERNREVDQEIWKMRPTKRHLVDAAVKNVKHLLALRHVLMEKMMGEFVAGVNIYLSHVRDASKSDSVRYQTMSHLLPISFQNLNCFLPSFVDQGWRNPYLNCKQESKDTNGFRENCSGIVQPNVNFSRDSLWHTGFTPPNVNKQMVQSGIQRDSPAAVKPEDKVQHPPIVEATGSSTGSPALNPVSPSQLVAEGKDKVEAAELSGTSLMRALVNQQTVGLNDKSDIDDLLFLPAGKSVVLEKKSAKQRTGPRSSVATNCNGTSYNFRPRNVLSQQEIDLGERLRKSTCLSDSSLKDRELPPGSCAASDIKPKTAGSSPSVNDTMSARDSHSHDHVKVSSRTEGSGDQPAYRTILKRTQALLELQEQGSDSDLEERGRVERVQSCSSPPSGSEIISPKGKMGRMQRLLEVLNKQNSP